MSAARTTFRVLALSALLSGAARADESDLMMARVIANCPGAAKFILEGHPDLASLEAAKRSEQAAPAVDARPPTNPGLRMSLLDMSRADQDARSGNVSDPNVVKRYMAVDAEHLPRLRAMVATGGFPTVRAVGQDGVNAAWLLVQHADADPAFQHQVLESLIASKQIGGEQLAMLTDRVLRAQGKPQRYGSQFWEEGGTWLAQPIEAPVSEVDARRAALGMMPMADYTCFLRTMYAAQAKPR